MSSMNSGIDLSDEKMVCRNGIEVLAHRIIFEAIIRSVYGVDTYRGSIKDKDRQARIEHLQNESVF